MALAERAGEILRGLPRGWERARLDVTIEEPGDVDRAAVILAPATPGRIGAMFCFYVGSGTEADAPTPEMVRRVLARLDDEGIRGRITLVAHEERSAKAPEPAAVLGRAIPFRGQWEALLERLPPDWSDLYAEVELDSTDFLERGALLLAPVNPAHYGGARTLRFRCASRKGYGVAAGMAGRCLERLDEERITGRVRALRVLSETHLAGTQGPVWLLGGRSV